MTVRGFCLVALFLCALAAPSLAAAQTPATPAAPAESPVIAELHFAGSRRHDEARIAAASGLTVGDAITRDDLQAAADRLLHLGLFSTVNFRYTSRGNQVSVQFALEDAPTVEVVFDDFPWFTDVELNAAVRSALPLFDGSAPTDGEILDQMGAAIAKLLAARGIAGTVEHTLIASPDDDGKVVQFRVDGPHMSIDSLAYSDRLAQNSERLKDRNTDLVGKPFSRYAIEVFEQEQLRPIYLASGNLQVRFGSPTLRLSGDPNQPLPERLPIVIPIEPGPVFHFSGVAPSGNAAMDAATIDKLLGIHSGDLADGMKLHDAWQRLETEYRHRGYLDVQIDAQPQFDAAGATVAYRLGITEGPQYVMHDLVLTGLSVDASNALRLRWELHRGQIADGAYVDQMLAKLEKPSEAMFGPLPVHYKMVGHLLRTDPVARTVDLLIDFH